MESRLLSLLSSIETKAPEALMRLRSSDALKVDMELVKDLVSLLDRILAEE